MHARDIFHRVRERGEGPKFTPRSYRARVPNIGRENFIGTLRPSNPVLEDEEGVGVKLLDVLVAGGCDPWTPMYIRRL